MTSVRRIEFLCALVILLLSATILEAATPIVMWHGMGDSCCFSFSLGKMKKMLEAEIPGVYVKSLKIGQNMVEDYQSGYFVHPNKQIKNACNQIKADPQLQDGFNAVGFSQGGQFLRGLIQRCPEAKVRNLITLGGQHQGVFGVPNCNAMTHKTCEEFRRILSTAAYTKAVQASLVQATYWHDPLQEEAYQAESTFLANINNEEEINEDYVENLQGIEKFVMVKFSNDTMVTPRESSWFQFYSPGQDKNILPLDMSPVFKRLGLDRMHREGKLIFIECDGNHLQFPRNWFQDKMLPYLRD